MSSLARASARPLFGISGSSQQGAGARVSLRGFRDHSSISTSMAMTPFSVAVNSLIVVFGYSATGTAITISAPTLAFTPIAGTGVQLRAWRAISGSDVPETITVSHNGSGTYPFTLGYAVFDGVDVDAPIGQVSGPTAYASGTSHAVAGVETESPGSMAFSVLQTPNNHVITGPASTGWSMLYRQAVGVTPYATMAFSKKDMPEVGNSGPCEYTTNLATTATGLSFVVASSADPTVTHGSLIDYDINGNATGFWIDSAGTLYPVDNSVLRELNDADDVSAWSMQNAGWVTNYFGMVFATPKTIRALSAVFSASPDGAFGVTQIQVSSDTTNGGDGTWTNLSDYALGGDGANKNIAVGPTNTILENFSYSNVKGIRLQCYRRNDYDQNTILKALSLYS